MEKNFLLYSRSFQAYAERRKIGADIKVLTDAVCRKLDRGYGYDSQFEIISAVQNEMDIGSEPIRRTIRMVNYAWKWLKANEQIKRLLLNEILGEGSYFKFVRIGIECLEKDGIRTVADLERIAGKEEKETPEASVLGVVSSAEPKAILTDVLPVGSPGDREFKPCELGTDLTEEAHEAVDRLIEIISAVTDQNRSMRADCVRYLDELRSLENNSVVLGARYMALEKKNEELFGELIAGRENVEKVEKDYQALLARIFRAETLIVEQKKRIEFLEQKNQKLETFFQTFSALKAELNGKEELSPVFVAVEEEPVALPKPKEFLKKKVTAQKSDSELPQWSAFFKRGVVFSKEAEEYLHSLRRKDESKIISGISFYLNNDPSSRPASNGKKIEGGLYDGCREVKAGKKYRVLLKEEADVIQVVKIFRKGQNVNNIKE